MKDCCEQTWEPLHKNRQHSINFKFLENTRIFTSKQMAMEKVERPIRYIYRHLHCTLCLIRLILI